MASHFFVVKHAIISGTPCEIATCKHCNRQERYNYDGSKTVLRSGNSEGSTEELAEELIGPKEPSEIKELIKPEEPSEEPSELEEQNEPDIYETPHEPSGTPSHRRHQYYVEHWEEIKADILKLGKSSASQKWNMGMTTMKLWIRDAFSEEERKILYDRWGRPRKTPRRETPQQEQGAFLRKQEQQSTLFMDTIHEMLRERKAEIKKLNAEIKAIQHTQELYLGGGK